MGLLARILAPLLFVTTLTSVAHADGGGCFVSIAPPAVRRVKDLTVISPARTESPPPGLRLRTHVRAQDHVWIGPDVPSFVPLEVAGNMALDLLDRSEGFYVAVYRERFDTCGLGSTQRNCATEIRLFDCNGLPIFATSLAPFLSRPDQLEVQDLRYSGGRLYFNEACQSYSRDAGGRCSSLVALDLLQRRVIWRTPSLVSNNYFAVMGQFVVAAYGFTGEPASIRVVRRSDGTIVDRQPLEGTNFEMTTRGDLVTVNLYYGRPAASFRLVATGDKASLLRVAEVTTPSPSSSSLPTPWPAPPNLDALFTLGAAAATSLLHAPQL